MTGRGAVPIVERTPGSILAIRAGEHVCAEAFIGDCLALADALPVSEYAINLVRDRYLFTVAFVAVLIRGQCNVLPPNPKPATQAEIQRRFAGVYVLHDGLDVAANVRALDMAAPLPGHTSTEIPTIPESRIAAVSYTSGSTGQSAPIPKTLGMFRRAVSAYASCLINTPCNIVATVPSQHMYGLELTSLFVLWHEAAMTAGKPFFPADVAHELDRTEEPRVLVTTPVHLRALLESDVSLPRLARVISATAPLDYALAREVEARYRTELLDVYGCSEVGCIGWRRAAHEELWHALSCYDFVVDRSGQVTVDGEHMDNPVQLQDHLEFRDANRFRFIGRAADMVNVGGKRGSLAELTRLLLDVPGVVDGQVFRTDPTQGVERLAAVFVGSADPSSIRNIMRRHIDDVLLPRTIIRVDRLPRTASSKLPREALLGILSEHTGD